MAHSKRILKRKLRKLRRDPRLFFYDAAKNRINDATELAIRASAHLPVKGVLSCSHRFTVIAAVYNVEKYLERFFESIVSQTVSIDDHLEIIMVDDGSTDSSASIVEKWRQKHPNIIRYYYKENGGQASARNLGLGYATGDWITFIDPDDFVHPRYFERVDRFISMQQAAGVDLGLLCCKWIIYHEDGDRFSDSHPLTYRFDGGSSVVQNDPNAELMVSSAGRSFFRHDILSANDLYFDERLRPNFEDGHFTGLYLLRMGASAVGFVSDAIYYYRKRSDRTSTLDTGWSQPSRFGDVVEFGYLGLLAEASGNGTGTVPRAIQKLVLYDLIWLFKRIVGDEASVSFLTSQQKERFRSLLFEVFRHIESSTIANFNLAGAWMFHKVGLLGMYKGERPPSQAVYVEAYDEARRLVELKYFYHGDLPAERFRVATTDVVPQVVKTRVHDFMGEVFVKERRVWIELTEGYSTLEVELDGAPTRITLAGVHYGRGVTRSTIQSRLRIGPSDVRPGLRARRLRKLAQSAAVRERFDAAWLFIDRDRHADDNAEHLYRYVREHHPEVNAYFVLHRSSHDWDRLADEGFRLIPFGSRDHHLLLLNSKYVVSSHADSFVLDVLPRSMFGDMLNFRFVFLQHGVIRDDISGWLNTKQIDLFITSSPREHQAIVEDGSRYKFGPHQVKMVGLSRHDALLARPERVEKTILVMPTWREWLISRPARGTTQRDAKPIFYESRYAACWHGFLHSTELRDLCERHGYRVVFFPHANMQVYAGWFDAPPWVDVHTHRTEPILQKLYRRAAVMVTDYSSVFFEMGVLERPVIYYQFDREEMYGGAHPSRPGYFSFEHDGFGPVVETEAELLKELKLLLERNCTPDLEYVRRMRETLPLRDRRNRERTVSAIMALDAPLNVKDTREAIVREQACSASRAGVWDLAEIRWQEMAEMSTTDEWVLPLAEAKRQLGKFASAHDVLASAKTPSTDITVEAARIDEASGDLTRSLERWTKVRAAMQAGGMDDTEAATAIARLLRKLRRFDESRDVLTSLQQTCIRDIELAELAFAQGEWRDAELRFARLMALDEGNCMALRAAESCARLGAPERALGYLSQYRASRRDARALVLEMQLLAMQGDLNQARNRLADLEKRARASWEPSEVVLLAKASVCAGLIDEADRLIKGWSADVEPLLIGGRVAVLEAQEAWQELVDVPRAWLELVEVEDRFEVALTLLRAHRELRDDEGSLQLLEMLEEGYPGASEVLFAKAETFEALQRLSQAVEAWREYQRAFPDSNAQVVRIRLALALEAMGGREEADRMLAEAARTNALLRLRENAHDAQAYERLVQLSTRYEGDSR